MSRGATDKASANDASYYKFVSRPNLIFLPFFISNKLEQFCVSWTIYFITAIFLFMAKYRKNCSNEIFSLRNALA